MATTKEGLVKKKIKEVLNDLEVWHFMPPANGYQRVGIPDIIACVQGHFLAIEVKALNLQPTALQKRELLQITKSGGKAICVNAENVDTFEMYMKKIMGVANETA
jgi:hypothetical protein